MPLSDTEVEAIRHERLAKLHAMSDHYLLLAAADIIANEPLVARGTFRDIFSPIRLRNALGAAETITTQPVACHCLEGAMREAAGVYCAPNPAAPWETIALLSVEIAYEDRRNELDKVVVRHFDRAALAKLLEEKSKTSDMLPTMEHIDEGIFYAPSIVYLYSDNVLAAMGADGPKEAERILRAAAASLVTKEGS